MTDPGKVIALPDLEARFPYMFTDERLRHRGIGCYRGWLSILTRTCEKIDVALGDDRRNFHWTHIGEKYGSACLRYVIGSVTSKEVDVGKPGQPLRIPVDRAPSEPVVVAVASIVSKAVEATRTTCCVCGAAAAARPRLRRRISPTLCVMHSADPAWLSAARIENSHG